MQRAELADFLRRHRERLRPADVGLPVGSRRRTPGLRREEVAALASASPDTYVRLEQARGPQPSESMLAAIARALRLTTDERDHLFHLAGRRPPAVHRPTGHVRPGLLTLLDHLVDLPAQVIDDLGVTVAQNPLARALLGDDARHSGWRRSFAWRWFTYPAARALYPAEDHDRQSRVIVADLRATAARRHGDADVADLVGRLRAGSEEFARLWAAHDVAVRRFDRKTLLHPVVGAVEVDCETLVTADACQKLLVLTPRSGTDAAERLRLLRVIGTQELESAASGVSPDPGMNRG